MGSTIEEKDDGTLEFAYKRNKNKGILLGILACWSVCFAAYTYQYTQGFLHYPRWCFILIHLMSIACSILPLIFSVGTLESPPIRTQIAELLIGLAAAPLLVTIIKPGPPSAITDYILVLFIFGGVDLFACLCVAYFTNHNKKATKVWVLVSILVGIVFTSCLGFYQQEGILCKIVVCCSAAAVLALSALYLFLRRRRSHSVSSRCFV